MMLTSMAAAGGHRVVASDAAAQAQAVPEWRYLIGFGLRNEVGAASTGCPSTCGMPCKRGYLTWESLASYDMMPSGKFRLECQSGFGTTHAACPHVGAGQVVASSCAWPQLQLPPAPLA